MRVVPRMDEHVSMHATLSDLCLLRPPSPHLHTLLLDLVPFLACLRRIGASSSGTIRLNSHWLPLCIFYV